MKMRVNCFLVLLLLANLTFAQIPQAFKYQAVARNSAGMLLNNASLTVRVGVRDISVTGSIVYQETHAVTTNSFGLINLNIGRGSVTSGTFTSINWGIGDKYVEIEIDYGTGYVSMGISQLLSVPYALYAANGPVGPQGPQGIQGIQGIQGPAGPTGSNGISLNWLGSFTLSPSTPSINDAYYDVNLKKSYVWNGSGWQIVAQDGYPGSSVLPNWQVVSSSTTISPTTDFVYISHGLTSPNFVLPLCSSVPKGKILILKRTRIIGSTVAANFQITSQGSDVIVSWFGVGSSAQVYTIGNPYENGTIRLISDGVSNWLEW